MYCSPHLRLPLVYPGSRPSGFLDLMYEGLEGKLCAQRLTQYEEETCYLHEHLMARFYKTDYTTYYEPRISEDCKEIYTLFQRLTEGEKARSLKIRISSALRVQQEREPGCTLERLLKALRHSHQACRFTFLKFCLLSHPELQDDVHTAALACEKDERYEMLRCLYLLNSSLGNPYELISPLAGVLRNLQTIYHDMPGVVQVLLKIEVCEGRICPLKYATLKERLICISAFQNAPPPSTTEILIDYIRKHYPPLDEQALGSYLASRLPRIYEHCAGDRRLSTYYNAVKNCTPWYRDDEPYTHFILNGVPLGSKSQLFLLSLQCLLGEERVDEPDYDF